MRINLYSEELTQEVERVEKVANRGTDEEDTFVGVRLFLESPKSLLDHSTDTDDDRNAVTFWVREEELPWLRGMMLSLLGECE